MNFLLWCCWEIPFADKSVNTNVLTLNLAAEIAKSRNMFFVPTPLQPRLKVALGVENQTHYVILLWIFFRRLQIACVVVLQISFAQKLAGVALTGAWACWKLSPFPAQAFP